MKLIQGDYDSGGESDDSQNETINFGPSGIATLGPVFSSNNETLSLSTLEYLAVFRDTLRTIFGYILNLEDISDLEANSIIELVAKFSEVSLCLASLFCYEKNESQLNENCVLLVNLMHVTAWDETSKIFPFLFSKICEIIATLDGEIVIYYLQSQITIKQLKVSLEKSKNLFSKRKQKLK